MTYKWPLMSDTITQEDRRVMIDFIANTDRFTKGMMTEQFENAWSQWLGCKYSLFVSSGSTANFLLLAAVKELYEIPDGAEVLLPSCTWMTNVAPVIQLGLKPVFVDINLENYSFDIDKLKGLNLSPRIVFTTHLMGFDAPIEALKELYPCAIHLEDVCESHGVTGPDGSKRGSNSTGATFSFYFGHHMTTIEGGMVSTNDSELYDLMRMKRSHGLARESVKFEMYKALYPDLDSSFMFVTDGYNFRSTDLNAVLGLNQLKYLDDAINVRRELGRVYNKAQHNLSMDLIDNVEFPEGSSPFCFPVMATSPENKKLMVDRLNAAGIENRPIVSGNLLRHPFLKGLSAVTDLTNVEKAHMCGFYVGCNHMLSADQPEYLVKVLRGYTQ